MDAITPGMDAITPELHPNTLNSPWQDPAVVDRLKVAWLHHSAAETARLLSEEFQITLTRNQVIGKIHRLGLTVDDQESLHRMARVRLGGRQSRPKRERTIRVKTIRIQQPEVCEAPVPMGLTLQELETESCRFPVRDDDWLFCGHQSLKNKPYCPYHSRVCYIPQDQRRRSAVPSWR